MPRRSPIYGSYSNSEESNMKARQYINMMGMAAAVLLSSCVKDTLYDTPHPDKGAVTISLTGLSADDNYVLDMDGKVADITGSPFTYPDLLNPGTHSMVIYNRAGRFHFRRTDGASPYRGRQDPCGRRVHHPPAGLSENRQPGDYGRGRRYAASHSGTAATGARPAYRVHRDARTPGTDTDRDRHAQRHCRGV